MSWQAVPHSGSLFVAPQTLKNIDRQSKCYRFESKDGLIPTAEIPDPRGEIGDFPYFVLILRLLFASPA